MNRCINQLESKDAATIAGLVDDKSEELEPRYDSDAPERRKFLFQLRLRPATCFKYMKAQILIAFVSSFSVAPMAFGQSYGGAQFQSTTQAPQQTTSVSQATTTTTTKNKTVYPAGVKGYLDTQMASSKDHRFHMTVNGKDLPLTPVRYHEEQRLGGGKTETAVDMKGVDGKVYEMEFVASGGVVSGGKIVKANGKPL